MQSKKKTRNNKTKKGKRYGAKIKTNMNWLQRILALNALLLCMCLSISSFCVEAANSNESILIVVSFDAFKTDYLEKNVSAFIDDFYKNGTIAKNMNNVFPTKTFVNHFSIGTGKRISHIMELVMKSKGNFYFFFSQKVYWGCGMWIITRYFKKKKNLDFQSIEIHLSTRFG